MALYVGPSPAHGPHKSNDIKQLKRVVSAGEKMISLSISRPTQDVNSFG